MFACGTAASSRRSHSQGHGGEVADRGRRAPARSREGPESLLDVQRRSADTARLDDPDPAGTALTRPGSRTPRPPLTSPRTTPCTCRPRRAPLRRRSDAGSGARTPTADPCHRRAGLRDLALATCRPRRPGGGDADDRLDVPGGVARERMGVAASSSGRPDRPVTRYWWPRIEDDYGCWPTRRLTADAGGLRELPGGLLRRLGPTGDPVPGGHPGGPLQSPVVLDVRPIVTAP